MGGHLADCHKWILIRHAVMDILIRQAVMDTNQTSSRGYISDKQSGNVANKTNQTDKQTKVQYRNFLIKTNRLSHMSTHQLAYEGSNILFVPQHNNIRQAA